MRTTLVLKTKSETGMSMDLGYRKGADLASVVGSIIKIYPVDLDRIQRALDAKREEEAA